MKGGFSEAELKIVVPSLLAPSNDKYLRMNKTNLISLISADTSIKKTIFEQEYYLGIMSMYLGLAEKKIAKGIMSFDKFDIMRSFINSMINLCNLPEQANAAILSPIFKTIIQKAFETKDLGLLKLVNNITRFCEPAHTKKMKDRVLNIRDIIDALPGGLNRQNRPIIYEMISILSNCCLSDDWEGFLSKNLLLLIN